MPSCQKCNNHFPNRKMIDGKLKTLCNRKYCLDCSPYKSGNRKKLHVPQVVTYGERTCEGCGRAYRYCRLKGHTLSKCNSCNVNVRKQEVKQRAVEYKGGRCAACGYDRCRSALSFHHITPQDKEFNISGAHCRSWDVLKKELDKTVLLCLNCHMEHHAGLLLLEDGQWKLTGTKPHIGSNPP